MSPSCPHRAPVSTLACLSRQGFVPILPAVRRAERITPCFRSRLVCLCSCRRLRSSSEALQGSESQAAILETEPPLAFVDTELTIMPFPFQHTGGGKAALEQFPFQIRTRFCAISKWCAACGHERHEAGCEEGFGRTEPSDGDENRRLVSACRHCGWREMPSFSMW
jgi:hypothetical protein